MGNAVEAISDRSTSYRRPTPWAAAGALGARIATHPWARTKLGAIETWPAGAYRVVKAFERGAPAEKGAMGASGWIFVPSPPIPGGFVLYLGSRTAQHWSWWSFGLAVSDLFTLALIVDEWRAL